MTKTTGYTKFMEGEIARVAAVGMTRKQAAHELNLSLTSIDNWTAKLGVKLTPERTASGRWKNFPTSVRFRPQHLKEIKKMADEEGVSLSHFISSVVVTALYLNPVEVEDFSEAAE